MSDGQTRLAAATLDGPCRITVRFNRRVPPQDWPATKFSLKTGEGAPVAIKTVEPVHTRGEQTTVFAIETPEPLDFRHQLFELWVEEAGSRLVSARGLLQDPDRFYDPEVRLGADYSPERTTFRLFAPTAVGVQVVIAADRKEDVDLAVHQMAGNDKGFWEATVPGNLEGKLYAYRLSGIGFNPNTEISDPYGTCMQGRYARSLIVDPPKTDPPGFRQRAYLNPSSPAELVIYEMHVRDFTIHADSGVSQKGKYLGLTESGARLAGDPSIKTGIDHLVELGVTHVQLMPVQDFDNAENGDAGYYWGYMPVQFNSPDGWYAGSVAGPARIAELKQAIQAFHEQGIGVILDVVYNHTAKSAPFDRLVPGYYYRKTPADNFCNGSGCGNEFASESPMGRKFILDSLEMWVREYQVDGFRFDLMGLIDLETMKQIKARLSAIRPDILLYGESWVAGPTPLKPTTDKLQVRGTGIGAFNDGFRDAIKGDRDGGAPGFIETGDRAEYVKWGLAGSIRDWAIEPTDAIQYIECHDNLTTWDKLLQCAPDAGLEELKRMARFGALILLTAQGTVFLHSGQEFLRSKRGHHNSYNLPDVINQVDWSLKRTYADIHAYYRGLIAVRKAHPAFRLRNRAEVEHRVWFGDVPRERCVAYILHGTDLPGEPAQAIVVLLNGEHEPVEFKLGEGHWAIQADADRAGLEPLGWVENAVTLPGHSGMILCR